ncbi:hypothetical protein LIER_15442 [Lithospermum erythrorhizon]|uniref:Reverse transcriptase domain-containing protein n=1 Tax=Lithospermum erythrorhizon TaxID=34254 RepID=A0AAV3Q4H9_LITER
MGDFNAIVGHSEQVGCKAINPRALEEFNECILNCRLEDAGYKGLSFSWTNGRVSKRLDRVLLNHSYGELFPLVKVTQLAKTGSDHAPLLVESRRPKEGKGGFFRFQKMWFRHEGFIKAVEENWRQPTYGDPLFSLHFKQKRLKDFLKTWNREVFGDVFSNVDQAELEVQRCESVYESSSLPADRELLHKAKAIYLRALAIEEDYLCQLSGYKWLQEGDKNTAFYHIYVRRKRKKRAILGIYEEGEWLTETSQIEASGVSFFQEHFSGGPNMEHEELIDCIPSLVTHDDNEMMMRAPTKEEVRTVVLSLNKDSVAGPDGFNGHFYHNFWELIADDIVDDVGHFLKGHNLPQAFTSTTIALIPKKEVAKSWTEYRPISLCTFANKIVTKLLSMRLASILPKLISQFQAGFVHGRLIQDNILLSQELMHHIDKGGKEDNVILNLDMSKAFDKLSWHFLKRILGRFGFSDNLIARIMACIDNCWFSLLVNGKAS